MKTTIKLILSVMIVAALASCDSIKTSKFDGTYPCYTEFTDGTYEILDGTSEEEPPTSLSTYSFTAVIDLQEITATIDGRTATADVSSDGDFYLSYTWSIPLIGEMTIEIDGNVNVDGEMSGYIYETTSVLNGLGVEKANGTFSGSKQ